MPSGILILRIGEATSKKEKMSKKKLAGIIAACIVGIIVVIAVVANSSRQSPTGITPPEQSAPTQSEPPAQGQDDTVHPMQATPFNWEWKGVPSQAEEIDLATEQAREAIAAAASFLGAYVTEDYKLCLDLMAGKNDSERIELLTAAYEHLGKLVHFGTPENVYVAGDCAYVVSKHSDIYRAGETITMCIPLAWEEEKWKVIIPEIGIRGEFREADTKVQASEFYAEFRANEIAAALKYNIHNERSERPLLFEITGKVSKAYPNFVYFVFVGETTGTEIGDGGIECRDSMRTHMAEFDAVREGDVVTVRGNVGGYDNGWVRVGHCSLVKG